MHLNVIATLLLMFSIVATVSIARAINKNSSNQGTKNLFFIVLTIAQLALALFIAIQL